MSTDWLRRTVLPWLMWSGSLAGAGALWCGMQRISAIGYVVSVDYTVSVARAGRVDELMVEVGDRVEAGEVVATLDAAESEAELAILAAEREKILAQLGAAKVAAVALESDTTRGLDQSLSSAELALRSAQSRRKVKSAELGAMSAQIRRQRELVDQRMADRRELDALTIQQATTSREVEAMDSLISQLVGEVASARGRRGAATTNAPELAVEPLHAELAILARREELLALRREELVLRAPSDGEVREVLVRPGEVVSPGSPVLTLVALGGPRVHVCMGEAQAEEVRLGESTLLYPRGRDAEPLQGHVTALEEHVGQLPIRCWRDPQAPEWGREVTVTVDADVPLRAGQSFRVAFASGAAEAPAEHKTAEMASSAREGNARALTTTAARRSVNAKVEKVAADAVTPRAMLVPVALAERSRLEPSGLLWWPERDRFILVSDDTGTLTEQEHAPWLFTMTRTGQVDAEPLRLTGVEGVSDLESIAPGPEGSLYILASQSLSRKGKRPPERQLFARVTLDANGGTIIKAVQFADLLVAAGPEVQQRLGVADLAELDLEGMTATAEGGLLLGLKAPLGARGEALIWRLGRPDRLLAGEGLGASELALWGSVPLHVTADGAEVSGGIADMLELADGSLLIGATAAAVDPKEQSGSLWHVTERARLSAPHQVAIFTGLKPEGIGLAPDGAAIVVVFDTGDETPQWLELPWPAR